MISTLFFYFFSFTPSFADTFPDFRLKSILENNSFISSQDLRGKVVLIDFWASWCSPCIESLPFYQKIYDENKSKGFMFLAINLDNDANLAKEFMIANKLSFPAVFDDSKRVKKALSINSIPMCFLLDKNSEIVFNLKGFTDEKKNLIKNKIKEMLK